MEWVYKLSFAFTGIVASCFLFTNLTQLPETIFVLFLAASLFQLYCVVFKSEFTFMVSIAKYMLHITIMLEIVIAINFSGILNFGILEYFFKIYFGRIILNQNDTLYKNFSWHPVIATLVLCIGYQVLYYVRSKSKAER